MHADDDRRDDVTSNPSARHADGFRRETADPNAKPRPDMVRRDFTSPVPTYKLVGDIACLRTGEGWLRLSTVIDLSTRMVVGFALGAHDGRHHGAGADVRQIARLRGRQRHIPRRPRRPAR